MKWRFTSQYKPLLCRQQFSVLYRAIYYPAIPRPMHQLPNLNFKAKYITNINRCNCNRLQWCYDWWNCLFSNLWNLKMCWEWLTHFHIWSHSITQRKTYVFRKPSNRPDGFRSSHQILDAEVQLYHYWWPTCESWATKLLVVMWKITPHCSICVRTLKRCPNTRMSSCNKGKQSTPLGWLSAPFHMHFHLFL